MSPTLEKLFDEFAEKYGNLTPLSAEDNNPKYAVKKQNLIRRYLKELGADLTPKFYAELWRKMDEEVLAQEVDDVMDPLVCLVKAKIAEKALAFEGLEDYWREKISDEEQACYLGSATGLEAMCLQVGFSYDELSEPYLKHCLFQLMVLQQHAIAKAFARPIADEDLAQDYVRIWKNRRYASLKDYNEVHPFVLALCPPSEIREVTLI